MMRHDVCHLRYVGVKRVKWSLKTQTRQTTSNEPLHEVDCYPKFLRIAELPPKAIL